MRRVRQPIYVWEIILIRLLIADDHALMREGLKQLFVLASDLQVVGEAMSGSEVLESLRREAVDILLLDMTMPGLSGEDLIARIRAHYPNLCILTLSMHNEVMMAQRALKAGANGYLCKDSDPKMLLAAIRRVVSGGQFLDPVIAEKMAFDACGLGNQAQHEALSDRESQILRMLANGRCVNDIAAELFISNKTVSTHKARMMEKMGFQNTADIVRYAISNGLTG